MSIVTIGVRGMREDVRAKAVTLPRPAMTLPPEAVSTKKSADDAKMTHRIKPRLQARAPSPKTSRSPTALMPLAPLPIDSDPRPGV